MGEQAQDVTALTRPFYLLVKIQPKTHAPPRIQFRWGQRGRSFKAVVESIQQKFTLFTPLGVPVRASLTVSFKEYKTLEEQLKELNLQSSDHTKVHIVTKGETLPVIAFREYGDATAWRLIADENADVLPDLRRLTPGVALSIPAIDVLRVTTERRR